MYIAGVRHVTDTDFGDDERRDFAGELPLEMGKVEHEEEAAETKRVVHAGGAFEGRKRDGGRLDRLLLRVIVGRDELGRVGNQGGKDEGHEKRIHARADSKLVKDVDLQFGFRIQFRRRDEIHSMHSMENVFLFRGKEKDSCRKKEIKVQRNYTNLRLSS